MRGLPGRVATWRKLVEERLEGVLALGDVPPGLRKAARYSVLGGGKRIRPILALAGAEVAGGDPMAGMPVAIAVEMVHGYSLVHDDLPAMDDAATRRGRPSCHVAFGEATAILVGDGLLTDAFGVLAAPPFPEGARVPAERRLAAVSWLSRAAGMAGMVGGQAMDTDPAHPLPDAAALEDLHRRKTAALITFAVGAGALLGGGDDAAVGTLVRYGDALGLLFQVTDDLLDIPADGKDLPPLEARSSYAFREGRDAAIARADALLREAIEALGPFGGRAALLADLARLVREREA